MGKGQNKKRIFFRAYWLVVFLLFKNGISIAQKAKVSLFLQNVYFYEMPKLEEGAQLKIDVNSLTNCDSLVGILKPQFTIQTKIDSTVKYWMLNSYLSFDYEDGKIAMVKVQKMRDSIVVGYDAFMFLKKEQCWQEVQIIAFGNIQMAIQYLKSDSFWAFYNADKSQFSEIDAIKAQFKDAEGVLDIDKLGTYLKTKPKGLEKYCDW